MKSNFSALIVIIMLSVSLLTKTDAPYSPTPQNIISPYAFPPKQSTDTEKYYSPDNAVYDSTIKSHFSPLQRESGIGQNDQRELYDGYQAERYRDDDNHPQVIR